MNSIIIGFTFFFVLVLIFAVIKSRRANPEQSATEMHPDNFKKPRIEMTEDNNTAGTDSQKKKLL